MPDQPKEELLAGGNVSQVYRVGETVRRVLTEDRTQIHRLLKHLESKNFPYAPRFLGIDDKGRETLSFIEGEVGNYPLKEYMWSDEALKEIARIQRAYHDAVSDFPFDQGDWPPIDLTPDAPEIICHNDFAIYNLVFDKEKPAGVIDFDVAAPGPRLWDIVYTLYTCVSLSRFYLLENGEKCAYDSSLHAALRKKRIQLFFDAYGIARPAQYLDMLVLRLQGMCKTIERKAGEGNVAFQRMIEEGHVTHYQEDIVFLREHGNEWE